jgi:hypothetical protein
VLASLLRNRMKASSCTAPCRPTVAARAPVALQTRRVERNARPLVRARAVDDAQVPQCKILPASCSRRSFRRGIGCNFGVLPAGQPPQPDAARCLWDRHCHHHDCGLAGPAGVHASGAERSPKILAGHASISSEAAAPMPALSAASYPSELCPPPWHLDFA